MPSVQGSVAKLGCRIRIHATLAKGWEVTRGKVATRSNMASDRLFVVARGLCGARAAQSSCRFGNMRTFCSGKAGRREGVDASDSVLPINRVCSFCIKWKTLVDEMSEITQLNSIHQLAAVCEPIFGYRRP